MTDDLVKRLTIKAGVMEMGEKIAWGSDTSLMREAADRIEELEAKLATCEKYKAAYAECDRIGTQAVRDLEAKLAKAVEALALYSCEDGCSECPESERDRVSCGWTACRTLAELKGKGDA